MTLDTQKAINYQPRKTKIKLFGDIKMGIRIKPSPITPFLLIISLKLRFLKKINIIKLIKETIQLLELMSPK